MKILGIETSCDETGAAVIEGTTTSSSVNLLSNSLATSLALHAETGGIIPEIAAREQVGFMVPTLDQALSDANVSMPEIDAIAVTHGPGLIGSLLVGVETAKTLSYIYSKPLIPVNHLYGHIYANWIRLPEEPTATNEERIIRFPALALVISGGHTDLVLMKNHNEVTVIGATRDDAAGEAFDKIGRLLGLPYPAGPIISKYAQLGDPKAFTLPRPMIGSGDYYFSFSGLKTAVLNLIKNDASLETLSKDTPYEKDKQPPQILTDLCASVQEAIIDTVVRKTIKAAQEYRVNSLLLGGGVAANSHLQQRLKLSAKQSLPSTRVFVPAKTLCTDNGAMIAAAAFYRQEVIPWRDLTAKPELYYE